MIRPTYYQLNDSKDDLFSFFEKGLLTTEEARGFYKGNIFKYVTRYQDKNGVKDLEKAQTYLSQLIKFEKNAADFLEPFKHVSTPNDLEKESDEYYTLKRALKQNNGSGIIFYE